MVGPWRHWVDSDAKTGTIGEMSFGPAAVVDTRKQYRLWLDRWLRGETNASASWPRVRVFAMGDNRWIGGDDWPLPGTRFVPYYVSGGKAGEPDAGRLGPEMPPSAAEPDRYVYDPADPTPFLWTKNVDSGGPDDYRPVEARKDVLVYTMAAARERMLVCGPIRATVSASTSAKDTDWVARLSLVRTDGYSQRLAEGWVSAHARRGDFRRDPVTPDAVETYQVDLWGTCVTVRPGERLRLALMSAAFPLVARNLNTGEPIATGTRMVVAKQAIHRGTLVTLPIVDSPTEIPPPR
jgi:putative CocE/NonD family hydrolase